MSSPSPTDDGYSEEYPLGGVIEPYDIEREKQLDDEEKELEKQKNKYDKHL